MAGLGPREDEREFAEETESLVRITLAPTIWAFHFALSYAAAAITCAKLGGDDILGLRLGIAAGTVVALAAIAWLGWRSWQQWNADTGRSVREVLDDLVEEEEPRHRFLGHAAFLLSVISFIGVVYTAVPVVLIGTCQ